MLLMNSNSRCSEYTFAALSRSMAFTQISQVPAFQVLVLW